MQFVCPKTVVSICSVKADEFASGCAHDCYRQLDLETNGATPINAKYEVRSFVQWRLHQRKLWKLAELPTPYATVASYAQPQRADWPVYDGDKGEYVSWSENTKHLESMLELDKDSVDQLRCISIFHKLAQERGKRRSAPHLQLEKTINQSRTVGG